MRGPGPTDGGRRCSDDADRPVASRHDWSLPGPDFYRARDADPRPSWGDVIALLAIAGVVLAATLAIAVVTDGRPEWLLTALGVGGISVAGAAVRLVVRRWIPSDLDRARLLGLVAPLTLFVFFGGTGTFVAWVLAYDPSCTDCGGRSTAWAVLIGGWAFGALFLVTGLRRRGQESRHRRDLG